MKETADVFQNVGGFLLNNQKDFSYICSSLEKMDYDERNNERRYP